VVFVDPKTGVRSKFRGNSIVEAIAAGNLVIAKKGCILPPNTSILTKRTLVNSFKELTERIQYFEDNPQAYQNELKEQRHKLNKLCFERPMKDIIQKCKEKNNVKFIRY